MRTDKPEYLKLYEWLRDEITKGAWPAGAKLPSRRQTALDHGVSAVTVEHSYELLCEEGYAEARPRSGFYVAYRGRLRRRGEPGQAVKAPGLPRSPGILPIFRDDPGHAPSDRRLRRGHTG